MLSENKTIILIGPSCVGKSTQGKLIAKQIQKESISIDVIGKKYYEECGFSKADFSYIEKKFGYLEAYRAWEPYRLHAVKRVLEDCPGSVIDFGAGHSHYFDKQYYLKVQSILTPYTNVILLLPTFNQEKSVAILRKRNLLLRNKSWLYDGYDFIYHWIEDEDNYSLAKQIVFTEGKSLIKSCNEIISKLEL
jgi:energy-coupling factor transporter ATP-binding protein EcfA2